MDRGSAIQKPWQHFWGGRLPGLVIAPSICSNQSTPSTDDAPMAFKGSLGDIVLALKPSNCHLIRETREGV
jgi:hypothetical protein